MTEIAVCHCATLKSYYCNKCFFFKQWDSCESGDVMSIELNAYNYGIVQ